MLMIIVIYFMVSLVSLIAQMTRRNSKYSNVVVNEASHTKYRFKYQIPNTKGVTFHHRFDEA